MPGNQTSLRPGFMHVTFTIIGGTAWMCPVGHWVPHIPACPWYVKAGSDSPSWPRTQESKGHGWQP